MTILAKKAPKRPRETPSIEITNRGQIPPKKVHFGPFLAQKMTKPPLKSFDFRGATRKFFKSTSLDKTEPLDDFLKVIQWLGHNPPKPRGVLQNKL